MSEYIIFPNAPITEALLDIRVELPEGIDIARLESFHEHIKDRFPDKKTHGTFAIGVQLTPDGTPQSLPASGGPQGFLSRSPNENKIAQARMDGFTFNKLKPYESWQVFCSEAKSLWNIYAELFTPKRITRIALRYINRIEAPLPIKDFKEYILTNPEVAPNLSQSLSHFFMQIVMPNQEIEASAIITETMEPPTENQRLPLIIDIDVFKERVYVDDKEEIWNDFEKLRIFKNDIFFNSITDKTKELFK